jgi:hypothetical protein
MKKVFVEKEEIIYYVRRRRSSKMGKNQHDKKHIDPFFMCAGVFLGETAGSIRV